MVKTKARAVSPKRAVARAIPATKTPLRTHSVAVEPTAPMRCCNGCDHGVDAGRCWMCWLFKTLIVLFGAFLILWVGFYMGVMNARVNNMRLDPALERLLNENRTEMNKPMSRTLNDVSVKKMTDASALLDSKTGSEFDREFLKQMSAHHESAIEMAKVALEKSSDPDLKALAQKMIDGQSAEINQMTAWQVK